jgi:hypothetical protein
VGQARWGRQASGDDLLGGAEVSQLRQDVRRARSVR